MDAQTIGLYIGIVTGAGSIYGAIRNFIKGVGWRKTGEFIFVWLLFTAIGIGAIGVLAFIINSVAGIFQSSSPIPANGIPSWALVAYTIIAIVAFVLAQNGLEEDLKKKSS